MTVHDIPALNATLNSIATILICVGYVLIRRGLIAQHRRVMTAAMFVSALFLVGYVSHKAMVGAVHTPFGGQGVVRTLYYIMLVSHIVLAISIAYLVPRTFLFAIKGEIDRHRAWARWTFPIWFYVSITGVLVYLCLYQWWPAPTPVTV